MELSYKTIQNIKNGILAYLILSGGLWFMRAIPSMDRERDHSCESKYMDYIFPITILHCPVKKEDTCK